MDISINVGYFGPHISEDKDLIKKLDDIGVSCVWTAEAYGFDAVTPLAYFSALTEKMNIGSGIMQIPARTPAMTAMTAVTLDQMSKGRRNGQTWTFYLKLIRIENEGPKWF